MGQFHVRFRNPATQARYEANCENSVFRRITPEFRNQASMRVFRALGDFFGVHTRSSDGVLIISEMVGFVGFPCIHPRLQKMACLKLGSYAIGLCMTGAYQRSTQLNRVPVDFPDAPLSRYCNACGEPTGLLAQRPFPTRLIPPEARKGEGNIASGQWNWRGTGPILVGRRFVIGEECSLSR